MWQQERIIFLIDRIIFLIDIFKKKPSYQSRVRHSFAGARSTKRQSSTQDIIIELNSLVHESSFTGADSNFYEDHINFARIISRENHTTRESYYAHVAQSKQQRPLVHKALAASTHNRAFSTPIGNLAPCRQVHNLISKSPELLRPVCK